MLAKLLAADADASSQTGRFAAAGQARFGTGSPRPVPTSSISAWHRVSSARRPCGGWRGCCASWRADIVHGWMYHGNLAAQLAPA